MTTLREEVINLSKDRLDESLVIGGTAALITTLGLLLGVPAAAGISALINKIKAKNWKKAEKIEALEKKAYKLSSDEVITAFDVDNNHLKTFVIPSEAFLMKFAEKKGLIAPAINRIIIIDDYNFEKFLDELKKIIKERYKELLDKLHLPEDEKIKKFLEKKLSVEFYCRGIVAFTKEQKDEIEKGIKDAIKEAGLGKFKFKLLSATYK